MKLFKNMRLTLLVIILLSLVLRCIAAYALGLEIDEAYYISYAMYPGISHFDHPPIVGFLIQFTTLNLSVLNEFTARFGFVILGTLSLVFFYLIGKRIKNERTGFFAVCIAAATIYITGWCGLIIIPDASLVFCLLVSFYFFLNFIPNNPKDAKILDMILAFLFFGLAIYSKYQAVYLGLGVFLYIIFHNRKWLKNIYIYLFALIPIVFIGLIVYWNYSNDFISFSFHENRVVHLTRLRFDLISSEIGLEFVFYNPVNIILIVAALFAYHKRRFINSSYLKLILWSSIPLIATVLFLSLYNRTLSHWVGISYIYLFIIAAAYLDDILKDIKYPAIYAIVMLLGLELALFEVKEGYFLGHPYIPKSSDSAYSKTVENPPKPNNWETKLGSDNPTLIVYEWPQVAKIFKKFLQKNPKYDDYPLVTFRYFPAGQMDYYVAMPNKKKLLVYGPPVNIHEYYFINKKRGGLKKGDNALYITTSRDFDDPAKYFLGGFDYFKDVKIIYRAPIFKRHGIVEFTFIYELIDFTGKKEKL